MRIAFDGSIYNAQVRGGISSYFTCLIEELAALRPGWELELHVNAPPLAPLPSVASVKVMMRPYARPRILGAPVNVLRREWTLGTARADVIHSTLYRPILWRRSPLVTTIHDAIEFELPEFYGRSSRAARWKRWASRNSDVIVTVSHAAKESLLRHLPVSPERIKVVYQGVRHAFLARLQRDEGFVPEHRSGGRPRMLYVGHRGGHKNFSVVARALNSPGLGDWELVLVGGGPLTPEEGTALAGRRYRHLPDVEDAELVRLYRETTVLVFPSLSEGFGIPLVEAMSVGAPIVASRIPSTEEVCGVAYSPFDPRSPESLRAALEGVSTPEIRRRLVSAGLERSKLFSWRSGAREIANIYESLARRGA